MSKKTDKELTEAEIIENAKKEAKAILNKAQEDADSIVETAKKNNTSQVIEEDDIAIKVAKNEARMQEKVVCNFGRDSEGKFNDIFVRVNGKTFLIKRGVDVTIPRYVEAIIEEQDEQDKRTSELISKKEQEQVNSAAQNGIV